MKKTGFILSLMVSFCWCQHALGQDSQPVTINQFLTALDRGNDVSNHHLVLNNVNFETGSTELEVEAQTSLNKLVRLLQALPTINMTVSGHTDNVGASTTNLALSKERALMVQNYLIERGVDATRLTYSGFGDAEPIASNETEQGREQNRRVEFELIQDETKSSSTNYSDVVTLNSGERIGGYNMKQQGDSLYYTRFSDGIRMAIGWNQIAGINYVDGSNYQTNQSARTEQNVQNDPPSSIHEEGSFWYQLRNIDIHYGFNIPKLSTNTDFVNASHFRFRVGLGVDFFHDHSMIKDSTKSLYKTNQFFLKNNLYLRTELNWTALGGIFRDRVYAQTTNAYYYLNYLELAFLMQTAWANDHINVHIGPSLLFKTKERIEYGLAPEQKVKFARFMDVPFNIGVFFRTPRWQQDVKIGLRYSFGLLDVTHNRNDGNIFEGERNFSRNFAIMFKYGI